MQPDFTFVSTRLHNNMSVATREEAEFTKQLYSGAPVAWAQLVERWSTRLYNYLLYNAVDEAEATKLIRLIFAEVVQAVVGSVQVANLPILIFSIAHHHILHYQRRNPDRNHTKQRSLASSADGTNDPGANFLQRFHQCKPEVRQVLLLYYLCDVSLLEIAQIVGQSEEFLLKTLAQAKSYLQ